MAVATTFLGNRLDQEADRPRAEERQALAPSVERKSKDITVERDRPFDVLDGHVDLEETVDGETVLRQHW